MTPPEARTFTSQNDQSRMPYLQLHNIHGYTLSTNVFFNKVVNIH